MRLLLSIVYVGVLGILAHYVGESIPRSWFSGERFPYRPFAFEDNGRLYNKIGIRKWKTRVPDMSRVMKDMLPKRVSYDATSESIETLIKETCVAEFTHGFLSLLSIGVYFIWKNRVGVILTLVCIVCNQPFILIQRYNRPHLIKLRNRLIAREERERYAASDPVL